MRVVSAIFFCIIIASGCNKKAVPSVSDTETNTNTNEVTEQPAETPQFQKIDVVPAYKEFKKINLTNLKTPADSAAAPQENLIQPRPVGAPQEAPPKNP